MMSVQDVLLKAMAKKITWWAAAEIIWVTSRTIQRWRERLEKGGYAELADRIFAGIRANSAGCRQSDTDDGTESVREAMNTGPSIPDRGVSGLLF
jgi:hypothetical protein